MCFYRGQILNIFTKITVDIKDFILTIFDEQAFE